MLPDIGKLSIVMPSEVSAPGADPIPTVFVSPMPEIHDTTLPVVHAFPIPTDPTAVKKSKPNALSVAHMNGKLTLKSHQYGPALAVAAHFEKPNSVAACVLVYYEVGTGKTFAALHAARTFVDITKGEGHVYIITTNANIESTWTRDWEAYKGALNETSPGASAPYTRALYWNTKDSLFKKTLKSPYMLIIDEAHLLRNGLKSDSVSGPKVLDICAHASYVMPLTATPIVRTVDNINALYSYMVGEEERIVNVPSVKEMEQGEEITSPVEMGQYFKGKVLYQSQDTSRYPTITESIVEVPLGVEYEIFVRDDKEKMNELHNMIKKTKDRNRAMGYHYRTSRGLGTRRRHPKSIPCEQPPSVQLNW